MQKVRDSLLCGWLCHLAHPRGSRAKHHGKLLKPERIDFIQDDVCACLCVCLYVFTTRLLYSNKENSLADICLETKDQSDNVYRCFNLSLSLALTPAFSCLLPCN